MISEASGAGYMEVFSIHRAAVQRIQMFLNYVHAGAIGQ